MTDFDRLCDICALKGVRAVLHEIKDQDYLALAGACHARARQAQLRGDDATAERLTTAGDYLVYLLFPYD